MHGAAHNQSIPFPPCTVFHFFSHTFSDLTVSDLTVSDLITHSTHSLTSLLALPHASTLKPNTTTSTTVNMPANELLLSPHMLSSVGVSESLLGGRGSSHSPPSHLLYARFVYCVVMRALDIRSLTHLP